MIRIFSRLFPKMIANNFYPQFSKNKLHKLDNGVVNELLSTFKHINSKTGFMFDIEHTIEREIITKIQCPTLIIHSRNDNSVSFEHAKHANKMMSSPLIQYTHILAYLASSPEKTGQAIWQKNKL